MKALLTKSQIEHAIAVINKLTPILSTMQQVTLMAFSNNTTDFEAHERQIRLIQSHIDSANIVLDRCKKHREEIGGDGLINKLVMRSSRVQDEIAGLERTRSIACEGQSKIGCH